MERLINRILLLCTLIGISFGAYAYIQERPTKVVNEESERLEKKIEQERSHIMAYVDQKDTAKSLEIQSVNNNINEKFSIMMKFMEKLDDRIYELQRSQSSARSTSYEYGDGT